VITVKCTKITVFLVSAHCGLLICIGVTEESSSFIFMVQQIPTKTYKGRDAS